MSAKRRHPSHSNEVMRPPKADLHLIHKTGVNSKESDFTILTDQKLAASFKWSGL